MKKFIPVIEKDVPLPKHKARKGFSDEVHKLAVGESVWLPTSAASARATGRRIFGKDNYACRSESKDLEAGARLWRLK